MHNRNAVRYFLIVAALLVFLFVSNDFGLLDVEKTAIVMAVGIDREDDEFIVTSQVALPVSNQGSNGAKSVQIVSRGDTVAAAFEEINDKTGWYPKLVFCKLILLGEKTMEQDVFDGLDFFLRNEYFSEDCLIAACNGTAKDALNVKTPIDSASSVAAQKVLSKHAEQVGSVMTNSLRTFSATYFGKAKSGYLPVLKTEQPQEALKDENGEGGSGGSSGSGGAQSGSQGSASQSGSADNSGGEAAKKEELFSAKETALFAHGKRVGTLTEDETFAFSAMKSKLKLANYTVESGGDKYTLTVKHNSPKVKLKIKNGAPRLDLDVTMVAGVLDFAAASDANKIKDAGDVPKGVLKDAEKALKEQILETFEKSRACGCDLFGLDDLLRKYHNAQYNKFKDDLLERITVRVNVTFKSIR